MSLSSAIEPKKLVSHFALATGGSLLILAAMFYAIAQTGESASIERMIEVIKASSWPLFFLYALTMLVGVLVRAYRYRVLLRASGETAIPNFKDMTLITAVRGMTVDLLPARLGELVYVWLLNKRAKTSVAAGLSSLLFATLMDIVVLAPFTIAIGLMVGFPNKTPFLLALIALFVVVVFIIGLRYILPWFMGWFERRQEHGNFIIRGISRLAVSINNAIQKTLRAGVFTQVLGLTFLVRFLKYAGLLILFKGITQTNFPDLAQMPSLTVLGSMIASEMTASLPIPALMSFGSWEVGGMTLLAIAGALPDQALLTMLGIHIQTQSIDYGVGLAALAALFLLPVAGTANEEPRQTGIAAWIKPAFFMLLAGTLLYAGYHTVKSDEQAASDNVAAAGTSGKATPAWLKKVDGFVVWSSNRYGNHDILMMSLPDRKIRRLTTDPHTETYPRISPDGKQVVFVRSHKEWQSQRDTKPWDVWLLDIASGKEKRIAQWGTAPDWSPDGKIIYFQRTPGKIIAYDLASGKESVFYESGKDQEMPVNVELYNPSVDQKGRLSMFFRNHGQPTNTIRDENGKINVVHRDGCQITWSPSGKYVFYVAKGGKQTNLFKRYFPDTGESMNWLDLPGDYSHEYFPRLSNDEKYMVLAASAGGHEHDIADYEVYLWKVNSDPASAVRLTHDTGNDSWPDVWTR